jgi:hypothetical protein
VKNSIIVGVNIVLFLGMQICTPVQVLSDAGPPDVITVSSVEEAENLMPVSGVIDSISLERREIVISDSFYQIAPETKYYQGKRKPTSTAKFTIGTWVGAYLDEKSRIKSLHLINAPEDGNRDEIPSTARPSGQKDEGFRLENGVYVN